MCSAEMIEAALKDPAVIRKLSAQVDADAVLEHVRTDYEIQLTGLRAECAVKDAEIARLRNELQKIASINQEYEFPRVILNRVCGIARAALEQKS